MSSSKIDSILLDIVLQSYDEEKGDSDPDIRGNGEAYYRLSPRLLKTKTDFSHDGRISGVVLFVEMEYVEVAIPSDNIDDDFYVNVEYSTFEEKVNESGICDIFGGLVEECLNAVVRIMIIPEF